MPHTFGLSDAAQNIFKNLYSFSDETIEDTFNRVAKEFATNDEEFKLTHDLLATNTWRANTPVFFNAGTDHKMFSACWVVGLDDSMNNIYDIANVSRKIFQHGAGIGIPIGNLREKDAYIYEGKKDVPPTGKSSGPVSFMKLYDVIGESTKSGGRTRRAAILCSMPVNHPDIMEFIGCKEIDGKLSNMNISVSITDKFMQSLKDGISYQLISPSSGEIMGEVNSIDVWNKLVDMSWKTADPGVLFIDTINKYNPLKSKIQIQCTNPCITGNTLIATADGRNGVTIKQLAEEEVDVPVYSTSIDGQVQIKIGRNPRKTGEKKEVWLVTLDDGSQFSATPDHEILLKDLTYCKVRDLKKGISLMPFNSFNSNNYRQISSCGMKMKGGSRRNRRQYRLISEFYDGVIDSKKYHIHHKDFNSFNDDINNLKCIPIELHKKIHTEKMIGINNPYHKMTNEWKQSFASHPGETNGRYSGYTNEQLIEFGKKLFIETGKITKRLWKEFCLKNNINYTVHNSYRFGSFSNFKSIVIGNHKVENVEFLGYEDVYNITVDDNHNYHIITSFNDEKYITSSGICVKNCGEQPLIPFTSCNLSSINVHKFCINGKFDFEKLYTTAYNIMILMDNIIDVMYFPDKRFEDNVKKYRPVGVGIMGLADALFELDLKYDGPDGRQLASEIMKTITTACISASADLASEKGKFFNYDRYESDTLQIIAEHTGNNLEIIEKVKKNGLRNIQFTTCAPTGTTALSCDCSYGIEPCFGLVFQKNMITGETVLFVNPIFKKKYENETWYDDKILEKIFQNGGTLKGLRGIPKEVRDIYITAHDIKYKDRIDMQSELQKYCSSAISSTINLPNSVTKEEVSDLYRYAYEKGLKGVTIYRDGSKHSQPITFSKNGTEVKSNFSRPNKLVADTHVLETGNGKMYVIVSKHNGKPVEIFMNMGKSGQLFNVFTESLGRVISIALQHGVPMEEIIKTMIGINSDRPTWFRFDETDQKPVQILSIPDGIAKLLQRFYTNDIKDDNIDGLYELCPKCGTYSLVIIEGCKVCQNCGESACG
jgi:ribonucleotide reductase alpha subunit